jgi:hypothetical protein
MPLKRLLKQSLREYRDLLEAKKLALLKLNESEVN